MEQSWQPEPKRPLRCPKASFSCSGEERGCVEAAINLFPTACANGANLPEGPGQLHSAPRGLSPASCGSHVQFHQGHEHLCDTYAKGWHAEYALCCLPRSPLHMGCFPSVTRKTQLLKRKCQRARLVPFPATPQELHNHEFRKADDPPKVS